MSNASNNGTSLWCTERDKDLIREYRDEVFQSSSVGLRHAVRHAIQQAQRNDQ
jgi:hypothetical protein